MNYRIVKTSKANLIHYLFSSNITHNKASDHLFKFSTQLIKICKSIMNLIFTPTKYVYDEVSDTCKPFNYNYYFKDITDLKLKASQRTFL